MLFVIQKFELIIVIDLNFLKFILSKYTIINVIYILLIINYFIKFI